MKKLVILATMFAAVTLASCGGDKTEGTENTDSTTAAEPKVEEVTEPVVDSTAAVADSTVEATPAAEPAK